MRVDTRSVANFSMGLIRKFEFMGQNVTMDSKKKTTCRRQIVAHDAHLKIDRQLGREQKDSMRPMQKNTTENTPPSDMAIFGMSLAVLAAVALMVYLFVFGLSSVVLVL